MSSENILRNRVLDSAIREFAKILSSGHGSCVRCGGLNDPPICKDEFVENWMQLNWEFIVESCVFWGEKAVLEVYGDGADTFCSRICPPKHGSAFFRVFARPVVDELIDRLTGRVIPASQLLVFDRLVSLDGTGWFLEEPPFDCVLLNEDSEFCVAMVSEVEFFLVRDEQEEERIGV